MRRWKLPPGRSAPRGGRPDGRARRWGVVLVLAAAMLVGIFGFTAFSIDTGYIALTKAQLQGAADASVLAASMELPDNLGPAPKYTSSETAEIARAAAQFVAGKNRAGDVASIHLDKLRDVRFGQVVWSPTTSSWNKSWGTSPYNLVEVTLRRDGDSGSPDGPLPLFFAPIIGHDEASLSVTSTAALAAGNGFRIPQGSTCTIGALPFALDLPTWTDLMDGAITADSYCYNADGSVSSGADGVYEVDLYPYGSGSLPPGNRGTVDLGAPNNSTADISRQILHGLNAYDLSYFPNNELRWDQGPQQINGDTGISAGFKDELDEIKGQPRLIPIFTQVSGNGNNAMYTVVKFVGVRVMYVKLTGNPKKVVVQPCVYSDPCIIKDTSGAPIAEDTIFTSPVLVN